jgi:hypothetical protein
MNYFFLTLFLACISSKSFIFFETNLFKASTATVLVTSLELSYGGLDPECPPNTNCSLPYLGTNHTYSCSDGRGEWDKGLIKFNDPLPPFSSSVSFIVSYVFLQIISHVQTNNIFHLRALRLFRNQHFCNNQRYSQWSTSQIDSSDRPYSRYL